MMISAEIPEGDTKWIIVRNGQRQGGLYETKDMADLTANALRQLLESQGQPGVVVEVKQHLLG